MRVCKMFGLSALAVASLMGIQAGLASASPAPSLKAYPVWCGYWDSNPVSGARKATPTGVLPGKFGGELDWGRFGGQYYVWARLSHAPAGEHIALYWKAQWPDGQTGLYQCGDSHAYSTATMWPGVAATWTAGVPVSRPRAADATAICAGYIVWSRAGAMLYKSPGSCLVSWFGFLQLPAQPQPAPGPPVLGSPTSWSVSLSVSPRRVHRDTRITLSGEVLTSPRPPTGKLVYLQARSVRRTWRGRGRSRHTIAIYGLWITFKSLRARPDGSFSATHTFQLRGPHRYQFQALAPAEGAYLNASGASVLVGVTET